jgi:hypothetical protein
MKGEAQMIDPINEPDGKKCAKQEEAWAKNRKRQISGSALSHVYLSVKLLDLSWIAFSNFSPYRYIMDLSCSRPRYLPPGTLLIWARTRPGGCKTFQVHTRRDSGQSLLRVRPTVSKAEGGGEKEWRGCCRRTRL